MKLCYILDNIHKQSLNTGDDMYFLINKFETEHINTLLTEIKESSTEISAFIIPCSLGSIHTKYFGIKVGLHIRLSNELGNIRFLPILFVSADEYRIIAMFDEENIFKFILTKGCRLIKYSGIMYTERLETNVNKCIIHGFDKSKSDAELQHELRVSVLTQLNISIPYGKDSHSIANEWGMTRFGFLTNCENIKSQDLFTKYLLAKTETDPGSIKERDKTLNKWVEYLKLNTLKVLFIDNDAKKGWNSYIKKFFDVHFSENYIEIDKYEDANYYFNKNEIDEIQLPDIILLDLRLEDEDDRIILPKKIDEYSGGKLLINIKKRFPFIPVIIFTASNKAWNIEALLQEGADGYYIKESPEYGISNKYSIETFKQFTSNLIKVMEKAKYLKKIWIYNSNIIMSLNVSIDNKTIRNSIEQKLNMAFAILNSHQTNYEIQNYVYNEFEFAFLGYWSILSELVADKYTIKTSFNKTGINHSWKISKENKFYIKDNKPSILRKKTEDGKDEGKLKYYISNNAKTEDVNIYVKSLYLQIVGLILLSNDFEKADIVENHKIIFKLIDETNQYRNNLELTHPKIGDLTQKDFKMRRNNSVETQKKNLNKIISLVNLLLLKEIKGNDIFS